jgi:hypothetical protein
MVSGALLWVFIGAGLALMAGTAALGIRRLLKVVDQAST